MHSGLRAGMSSLELLQQSVERISDGEPAARQVPDTTLDNRLREGNTYLEHPAPGVSLDSGLMEGMS